MRSLLIAFLFLVCGLVLLFSEEASATRRGHGIFKGVPGIVDGDSLILDHQELRLLCMDAVELHQSCQNEAGDDYPCGEKAKQAMQNLIKGRSVACYGHERDKYDRPLVHCYVDRTDLSLEMVRQGWAIGTCRRSKALAKEAKEQGLGIWQGRFLSPPRWRKQHPWHKDNEQPPANARP